MQTPSEKPARRRPLDRFGRESAGSVSMELVIVLPLLLWALAATVVFFDGFRTRYHAQMAAQTVADVMSRETNLFTAAYVEGLNGVFDFLADQRGETRIRVSSVIWDSANNRNRLQWSYGTRGLAPLPANTFELMQANDLDTLRALFGTATGFSFASADAQMPIEDLPTRIPPVLPGEALLLVESFALWSPFAQVGVGQIRLAPVVVVRPRFAPWINFDGIAPVYPDSSYEIAWTGGGNTDLPDPNDPVDPPDGPTNASFTFDSGVTTGWTATTITQNGPTNGFLGPFGPETFATPVALNVNLGGLRDTATIEFDLLVLDSWDGYDSTYSLPRGDTITLMINGLPIDMQVFATGIWGLYGRTRVASVTRNGATYAVRMVPTRSGTNFFGASYNDQIWRVTMTITQPLAHFTLGFSAGTDSASADESFGIDNVLITATGSGGGQPAYTPPAHLVAGADPHTRFERLTGCPEVRNPAPWLSMARDDLTSAITLQRQAGGPTALAGCNALNLSSPTGYISGSPQLVFNYDNQGVRGNGNRLRIRLEDNNNGRTCDTTLLIQDPNGQWWFNDDQNGWNAGLNLGNAVSGAYRVFIGTYGTTTCNSRISFTAY